MMNGSGCQITPFPAWLGSSHLSVRLLLLVPCRVCTGDSTRHTGRVQAEGTQRSGRYPAEQVRGDVSKHTLTL